MKEYIKNIIAESLKDEVDVDREWERLFSSIEKKTISKMKTRRLFLQYMKYAAERRAICNYRMVRRFGLTLVQL